MRVPRTVASAVVLPASLAAAGEPCPDYGTVFVQAWTLDLSVARDAIDLDGDGDTDMVVAFYDGPITAFRNDGAGVLDAPEEYLGAAAQDLALGDLDGDGAPDLATATSTGVVLRLNQGDGTFGPEFAHDLEGSPVAIALGDVDDDGDLDVAVIDFSAEEVVVLRNDGAGALLEDARYAVGPQPRSIEFADVDGDGDLDAVTSGGTHEASVVVTRLNAADGTFPESTSVPEADATTALSDITDVDGDGKQDLVIVSLDGNFVRIRYGSRDAAFAEFVDVAVPPSPFAAAVADLDGDGAKDIACLHPRAGAISIHLGEGDGRSFALHSTVSHISGSGGLALIDMNGDDVPDLVSAYGSSDVIAMQLAHCPRSCRGDLDWSGAVEFGDLLRITSTWGECDACAEDLDGDGRVGFEDLCVVLGAWGPCTPPGACCLHDGTCAMTAAVGGADCGPTVGTYFGDGTTCADVVCDEPPCLEFAEAEATLVANGPRAAAIGDLNGDGHPDVAVACASGHGISILHGDGTGAFPTSTFLDTGGSSVPVALALGDLDGDGDRDLVVADSASRILIGLNVGNGTFAPLVAHALDTPPTDVALGDLDGDGFGDIVTIHGEVGAFLVVLRNDGAGAFEPGATIASPNFPRAVDLGDLDDDGDLDIALVAASGNSVRIYRNSGDGISFAFVSVPFGGSLRDVLIADIDGDGRGDLLATEYWNRIGVRRITGALDVQPYEVHPVGTSLRSIEAADFDLDGDLDVIVGTESTLTTRMLRNVNGGVLTAGPALAMGQNDSGIAVGDLDGDGAPDVVVANRLSGTISTAVQVCPVEGPAPGACCLPSGLCETRFADDCALLGGTPSDAGVDCSQVICPPMGACCLLDGTCVLAVEFACDAVGGSHLGVGSDCDGAACTVGGACCYAGGLCLIEHESACIAAGGSFLESGSVCDVDCARGACCLPDGTCFDMTPETCALVGGALGPLGIPCTATACP